MRPQHSQRVNVEVVTISTKTLNLVFLVFLSAEAIDSIWTKD